MFNYLKLLFCLLLIISVPIKAQKWVRGVVCDSVSGSPIPDVSVTTADSRILAVTDSLGRFKCLPFDGSIRISLMGYKLATKRVEASDSFLICRLVPGSARLNEFTVTANYSQNITKQFSMSEMSDVQIRENISTSLTDVLDRVPGLVKKAEFHSPIVLRGLSGKRLLVTKDGDRRMGTFPGGFMSQSVNIYSLGKVEVMRGPSSVRYGSGAIAGVINLVSQSPFSTSGWHSRIESSYGTNNQEKAVLYGVSYSNDKDAIAVSGRLRDASEYYYPDGTMAKNSEYSDKDASLFYGAKLRDGGLLSFNSEAHLGGLWGRPLGFNGTPYLRLNNKSDDVYHSSLQYTNTTGKVITRNEFSVFFDYEYRDQLRAFYDIGTQKLSYTEETKFSNHYGGARSLHCIKLAENIMLNTGFDAVENRISTPTEIVDYFLGYHFQNKVAKNSGVFLSGIFVEGEYSLLNDKLKIIAGIRANYAAINEGDVHDTTLVKGRKSTLFAPSGTFGSVYQLTSHAYMSFNYAHSYRAPDASEMFVETSSGDALLYGNSKLKPEYGHNFDAGLRGNTGAWGWGYDASVYANFLYNFIDKQLLMEKKGVNYTYVNIGKAFIRGGELSVQYRTRNLFFEHTNLECDAALVGSWGDDVSGSSSWFKNGTALIDIPPVNSRTGLKFIRKFPRKGQVYVGADFQYFGYQSRYPSTTISRPDYMLLGVSSGFLYQFGKLQTAIRLKVDNITNNYYYPFESILPGVGRNMKMFLSVSF